ncbi:MAG: hypothetical protein ACRDOH_31715 [Streptosporangiaceae bacterium]
MLTAAEAKTIRQALADAIAHRTSLEDAERAASYEAILRRLVTGQEVL